MPYWMQNEKSLNSVRSFWLYGLSGIEVDRVRIRFCAEMIADWYNNQGAD